MCSVCWLESGKKSDRGVNLIASLCEKYHTSEDELSKALEKTNTLIMDILKKEPRSAASECQQDNLSFIDPGKHLRCKQKFNVWYSLFLFDGLICCPVLLKFHLTDLSAAQSY